MTSVIAGGAVQRRHLRWYTATQRTVPSERPLARGRKSTLSAMYADSARTRNQRSQPAAGHAVTTAVTLNHELHGTIRVHETRGCRQQRWPSGAVSSSRIGRPLWQRIRVDWLWKAALGPENWDTTPDGAGRPTC